MGLIIKNGIIYNGAESEPVVYSLDEREIGVWTDGKPLYQRTIQIGPMSKSNSWQSYNHNILNIDTIVMARGWMKDITNNISYWYEIPQSRANTSNGISIEVTDTVINYFHNWLDNVTDSYITLQYTKTTDTPGSGTWTSGGVKTVHYSENEQVIGTWIDGSTLYERTLYKDLSGQAEHWYVYLDTLIDDINNYTIINFQGQLQFKEGSYIYAHVVPNAGASYYINRNSGRWYLYFHSGNATCTWGYMTATIRYVKKILGQPSS